MVKVVIGTKICSFEELVEEYSRVCGENKKLEKEVEDRNIGIACLEDKEYEQTRRIVELESKNKEANDKIHKLEVELAEKDARFKIRGGLNAEPLPFSGEQYEEDLIEELEDRHQQDCITINQLHTTIDTLVDRYAKLRKMRGL